MKLREHRSFVRFWIASTTSSFGTYITTLALQVLVVGNMGGSAVDVGWVSASRWLPYVLLGLIAGFCRSLSSKDCIGGNRYGAQHYTCLHLLNVYHRSNQYWLANVPAGALWCFVSF